MATVIRLKRGGRTHAPYYRVVVTDSRGRQSGRVLEEIGLYQPCARPEPVVRVDKAKALGWLYRGAQTTDTARNILSGQGVFEAFNAGRKPEEFAPAPAEAIAEPAGEQS